MVVTRATDKLRAGISLVAFHHGLPVVRCADKFIVTTGCANLLLLSARLYNEALHIPRRSPERMRILLMVPGITPLEKNSARGLSDASPLGWLPRDYGELNAKSGIGPTAVGGFLDRALECGNIRTCSSRM